MNAKKTDDDPIKEPEPWTQYELDTLHEMVRNYAAMQLLKRKAWVWGVWLIGMPTAVLSVWEPLVRLWKLLKAS